MTPPVGSVRVTMVLLNVLRMWAWPLTTFFLSLRRGLRAAAWRVLVAIRRNSSGGYGGRRFPQRREMSGGRIADIVRRRWPRPVRCGGRGDRPRSAGLLLARHGALGALAGTSVGLGALTAHRQAATMAQ